MANTLVYPSGIRNFSSAINVQKAAPTFEMIYDESTAYTDAAGRMQTGGWRALTPEDFSSNISLTGVSLNIGAVAITGNPNVTISNTSPVPTSGNVNVTNPILAVSGLVGFTNNNVAVTGGSINVLTNPIGVTGTYRDLASGYSGIDPNQRFLMVGGRAVSTATGFVPNYQTGNPATFNFDTQNGGLLVQQTDLDYSVDSVTVYYPNASAVSNSVPSGAHPTGINMVTGTILAANTGRKSWFVQNMSTTSALLVKLGSGPVSSGSFNFALNPASTDGFGGGSWSDDKPSWVGEVSISGNGRFISWEL